MLGSCTKELSVERGQISGIASIGSDSTYLDKIYYSRDTGTGFYTFRTATFYYDNLKRNIRTTIIPNTPEEVAYDYLFAYSGTEMRPSLTTNYQISLEDHDTIIRYHFYDGSGRLVRDSGYEYHHDLFIPVDARDSAFRTYTYTGNMIYSEYRTISLPPVPMETDHQFDTATVDSRGNILNIKMYRLYNGNPTFQTEFNYTFDNRLSPYTKLTSLLSRRPMPEGDAFFEDYSFSNMLSSDEYDTGSYNYTFNNAGFPTIATGLIGSGVGSRIVKVIYTYKTL